MNRRKSSAHLTAADSYFLITLKGDTLYVDIDVNGVSDEFAETIQDELDKMLAKRKFIDDDQVRTHKENKL